jgi:hypothetical protein
MPKEKKENKSGLKMQKNKENEITTVMYREG